MNIEEKEVKRVSFPTSDKVTVDGHFGHTKEFVIYTIKENVITEVKYVTPPPHAPGVLPQFLAESSVDVIITGGMGQMAVELFQRHGIDVVLGAAGRIDVNLNEYLGGFLTSKGSTCTHEPDHTCDH
ncbi:MAG: dinitrogenase iron-molybdenum cofactor [Candidatus Izimaplasma sp.]|nr:dinitrogenase iron-molybdenum cofactor [Candidatus Izimaplasma bacterium]